MNIKWINHNNKMILYADYRGLKTPEMINQLIFESDIILKSIEKVLYLGNFEGASIESEFIKKANELGKKTELRNEKSAIVEAGGMKAIILNNYNLITGGKIKAFNTEQKALEYLTN